MDSLHDRIWVSTPTGHRSSTVLADDLLDDILEVAQDDATGHLDAFAIASLDVRDVGGLDDRFPRRIEFEDRGVAERRWRGAIGSHGGSLPDESSFALTSSSQVSRRERT